MITEEGSVDDFKLCVLTEVSHKRYPCNHVSIDVLTDLDEGAWYTTHPFFCLCDSPLNYIVSSIVKKGFAVQAVVDRSKVPVLHIGSPNRNQRIYNEAVVDDMLKKLGEQELVVYSHEPHDGDPSETPQIAGRARMEKRNGKLLAHISFLDQNMEMRVTSREVSVRTSGRGNVDKQGNVLSQYEVECLFLTDRPA